MPQPASVQPHLPLSMGALADIVGFHLARANVHALQAYEHHIGGPLQLRKTEFSLLMLLLANPPVTPKRLLRTLSLTAPKLSLLVDGMAGRGLLRRERNPADGRSQHLVLTDKGRRLATRAADAAGPMEQDLQARLTRAEHAMLVELLGKLAG
ncbi:MAG: MarR family winged helix-turn-helix transcriptional regulator [Aquabacterium sp.]